MPFLMININPKVNVIMIGDRTRLLKCHVNHYTIFSLRERILLYPSFLFAIVILKALSSFHIPSFDFGQLLLTCPKKESASA